MNAYDLSTGNLVASWNLPAACVGNSIDLDNAGNYYVGDIGPDTRIIKIDPSTNQVTTWADDASWTDGGFGTGGMVWNQSNGFYVAHAGSLWWVPQNGDGSAGAAVAVSLTGTVAADGSSTINADGMTWAGANTIFYAENDVFTPGWNGIVHRVELSAPTTGTNSNYLTGINDCSGVYFGNFNNQDYLYVNESQFGVPFGVNQVPPSNPFCVKVFPVNDVISGREEGNLNPETIEIYPNPTREWLRIQHPGGKSIRKVAVYAVDGRLTRRLEVNAAEVELPLSDLDEGMYLLRGTLRDGQAFTGKVMLLK